ncbi:MAG: MFS transporter [Candidatus Hodarchaeota archaeon]
MSETIKPRELHGPKLFGYSVGFFGLFLTNLLISVFAFQFYVYTINLNSLIVSVGIAIRLILAAVFSIVFGVMTDNKKPGRFGKRRPFLIYGLPIWVLTSILIWIPPWYCPKNNSIFLPTTIYFWIVIILNSISGTSILTAHISMLPEQSQTHNNRKSVASMNTFFTIIASILALLLPLMIQSILEDPTSVKWWEPSGKVILFFMPLIGIAFVLFGLISLILTFFSVDESFHNISQTTEMKKKSILATFQQMVIPAKDKKYRKYLAVRYFNSYGSRILGILVIPFLAFVLKFKGNDFYIYVVVSIFCKFGWFFIWKKILEKEKQSLIKTYSLCVASSVIASFLEVFFLINMLSFEFKIILFVITIGTILGAIYSFRLFATPLAGVLVYEAAEKVENNDKDKAVSELSGAYFGLQTFMMSVGQASATVMVGIILMGPNSENPIIITLCLCSMGIFFLISILILGKIKLERSISDINTTNESKETSRTVIQP